MKKKIEKNEEKKLKKTRKKREILSWNSKEKSLKFYRGLKGKNDKFLL